VNRRGQSLVEATLVIVVFFALLLAVIDCGQVLFAHQSLVERVRSAVRWGTLHPWDGGDSVANFVLYGEPVAPTPPVTEFLGLKRENVEVRYRPSTLELPDDDVLSVAIVDFVPHYFSPWIGQTLVSARPVIVAAPMSHRASMPASD
jgi:hypothetical protein